MLMALPHVFWLLGKGTRCREAREAQGMGIAMKRLSNSLLFFQLINFLGGVFQDNPFFIFRIRFFTEIEFHG